MAVLGDLPAEERAGKCWADDGLAAGVDETRQSERRLRTLVENAHDLLVITDVEGKPVYISPSVRGIVGPNPENVLGTLNAQFHHPDDVERRAAAFEKVLREGGHTEVEFRVRATDGTWHWLEVTMTNLLHDPDVEGMVLAGRDVTERRVAEEALRVNEERWRALLVNSSDVITVLGADGRLMYNSPSVEGYLGFTADELLARDIFELVHPDDLERAAAILADLVESEGPSAPIEMRVRHADGRYVWVEAIATNKLDDPAVGGIVVNARDITERKAVEEALLHQARTDLLTGLANRFMLLEQLGAALTRSERTGRLTAVLFLDLDHFKLVNDSLGHAAGDALLIAVAERLRCFLPAGTVARLGGDEFVLCCEGLETYNDAAELADRVADLLAEPIGLEGDEISVTASVGITCACDRGRTPEELLRDADVAMYRAKERGRARFEFFLSTMRTAAKLRLEQQLDIRRALNTGQFRMTYQPVIGLADGRLVGAEALVRWAHPRRGLVLPGTFIPAAEETGLIEPLGTWVLAQSIAEAAAWNRRSSAPVRVSVNLSARQVASGQMPALVNAALEVNGLDPDLVCLEITESLLVDETEEVEGVLQELAATGVRLAIDDFGTGYSSLA
ncbi:MAG: PAS domain S-box protein, partial [Acidimicrobiia bacterium]|nr:PAS domain S-box protein [Acidimicrobiia bacterium]